MDCIFCKIINKEIPSKILYEDDLVVAFLDINQYYLGHTLIIPKKHLTTILDADNNIIAHMFDVAKKLSKNIMEKFNQTGISYVINYGTEQEVMHLHFHLLGGKKLELHI